MTSSAREAHDFGFDAESLLPREQQIARIDVGEILARSGHVVRGTWHD